MDGILSEVKVLELTHAPSGAFCAKLLADPGFGRVFTAHMAMVRYSDAKGWHDARITARFSRSARICFSMAFRMSFGGVIFLIS